VKSTEEALAAALPAGDVHSDQDFRLAVFGLARHLKAVPDLRDRQARELRPLVRNWHEQAAARLGDRTFADTCALFAVSWKAVRFAAGEGVLTLAWENVSQQQPPPEAEEYGDRIGRLIVLCRELQNQNETSGRGSTFSLSGYQVADLFGVSQQTARTWLAMLVDDGVLEITDPGGGFRGGRRMAREYRMARENRPAEPRVTDNEPDYDLPF
jgi:hypothetical protein